MLLKYSLTISLFTMKQTSHTERLFTGNYQDLNRPLTTAETARAMVLLEDDVLNLAEMYFVLMLEERNPSSSIPIEKLPPGS